MQGSADLEGRLHGGQVLGRALHAGTGNHSFAEAAYQTGAAYGTDRPMTAMEVTAA